MSDYGNVELSGDSKVKVVKKCSEQLSVWDIAMPEVEPLCLDFGLGEFFSIGETEFWVANEVEAGYCTKFLFLFEGQRCPCHFHKVKHETFYVLKGGLEMTVDDVPQTMNEGDILVMQPGKRHTFLALEPSLIIEASMPSTLQDNFFDDRRIGDNGVI